MQGVRDVVRRDFAPRRRSADSDVGGHVGLLMQRVGETSLQEIDDLIVVLKRRREKLLSESARVQREMIEYAQLSQSTMQATKIIAESLGYLNKVPDAPRESEVQFENTANSGLRESAAEALGNSGLRESAAEALANSGLRESAAEALAQISDDDETFGGQAEVTAVPDSPAPETS